jgi:hypothetical protein
VKCDHNCTVTRQGNSAWILRANLHKICLEANPAFQMKYTSYAIHGQPPHPDHIRVAASIDIDGDGELVIPDHSKVVIADTSIVGKPVLKIE